MEQYLVSGMSCASCSARVEKAVLNVPGVTNCAVNLLTGSMGVEGTAQPEKIILAVKEAGYGAALKDANGQEKTGESVEEDALKDREMPLLKRRLAISLVFLLPLLYVSMGHMMWNWPLPAFLAHNHVAAGLLQLLLTSAVMVVNQKFFINGWKGLLHRAPNMDTLVALGAGASFLYSTYALFAMTDALGKGDSQSVMHYMHELYFESAAMILAFITVGKMLEAHSKGKTTDALRGLMKLSPRTAVLFKEGKEEVVGIDSIKKGDIFVVRPGESIPVDGIVIEGNSAVNESALTGESVPADKTTGDEVFAATLNQSGFLKCEAARVGEDTTLSQIIRMVSDAAATKAPIAKVADKVSSVFVPVVIAICFATVIIWLLAGAEPGFALARGISVLVISCPCALGLATPVAIMVGNGVGAKNGILFKTAVSLEETGKVSVVALDKTGTITKGEPAVTDLKTKEGISREELLSLAYALEAKSEHPLAKAIVKKAQEEGIVCQEVNDFTILPGNGVSATIENVSALGGNQKLILKNTPIPQPFLQQADDLAKEGKTPIYFSRGKTFIGMIAVADVVKQDSPQAIKELQDMGISVVMLTGDNERTAQAVGRFAGVDEVIAEVLPNGKENVIRDLMNRGRVAMVGDGINDAPALTRANIGIAIGAGTDIAIDAADVVLTKSKLSDVLAAIRLSRATLRNIHENLFWAFFYNVIGIPLAAGVFIPLFHWQLNPMFAAAAMSLSSFCVVTNALRLNFVDIRSAKKDKKRKNQGVKEKKIMERTFKIEGMMCAHCEARVKESLEKIEGVTEACVSHETGIAVVKMEKEIAEEVLYRAVTEQGYHVCLPG